MRLAMQAFVLTNWLTHACKMCYILRPGLLIVDCRLSYHVRVWVHVCMCFLKTRCRVHAVHHASHINGPWLLARYHV